jgi:hypothetical protein
MHLCGAQAKPSFDTCSPNPYSGLNFWDGVATHRAHDFEAVDMTTPLKIAVFIDSCAWNELFSDNVDLAEVFPQDRYSLFVTREVEIELLAIPTTGKDGTDNRQLYGGFGQGTWQSDTDRRWNTSDQVRSLVDNKGKRTTGLAKNQADASLAVRSFDSIVLTNEGKENSGPLRLAAEQADVKAGQFSVRAPNSG